MSGCNLGIIQYHVLLCIVLFTERHSLYLSTKYRGQYRKGDLLQAVFLGILQDGSLGSGSERKEPRCMISGCRGHLGDPQFFQVRFNTGASGDALKCQHRMFWCNCV